MKSTPLLKFGEFAPEIVESAWVAPTARVVGRVTVGAGASVWFGAVLRAEIEPIRVGTRSNVQDLCVLHTDPGFPLTIGTDCTVGHRATLHGCTIGDGSLIGIGAIVLNGARIGKACLVGAGAVVCEGTEIPDRSLVVGLPAKVKRGLTDEEVAGLLRSAAGYVVRAGQYRAME